MNRAVLSEHRGLVSEAKDQNQGHMEHGGCHQASHGRRRRQGRLQLLCFPPTA